MKILVLTFLLCCNMLGHSVLQTVRSDPMSPAACEQAKKDAPKISNPNGKLVAADCQDVKP